jgi:ATP-dependent Lhr-like helicase
LSVFEILDNNLKSKLPEFGFITPTGPQVKAIPKILKGNNILIVAPTGIGKTEAAMFPIISKILELKGADKWESGIKALYITPLKSLNRDIFKRLIDLATKLNLTIEVRHGDTTQSTRRKQALSPPDILIITPETLQAILPGKRMRVNLKSVKYVVVDEIHELANDERGAQLAIGLERLVLLTRNRFQRIGLSATVGNVSKVAKFLVGVNEKVKIVYFSGRKDFILKIDYTEIDEDDKKLANELKSTPIVAKTIRIISKLIKKHRSVLLFTNTREAAEILASKLALYDPEFDFAVHHGSLSREVRLEAEKKFKDEIIKCVICTSSLELGIDIGSVDFVIQFMSPRQVSKLIQRMGRSGHRLGEISKGYVIAVNSDDILETLAISKNMFANKVENIIFQENSLDVLCHQISGITLEIGSIDIELVLKIIRKAYPYRDLTYDDFLSVIDYMNEQKLVWKENNTLGRRKNTLHYYYNNLSMIPDVKQFRVIDITSNKSIGNLDEEFVINNDVGTIFIAKGQAWKVLVIEEGIVKVQPVPSPTAAIPSWEGELMPVPNKIAEMGGKLRSNLYELFKENISKEIEDKILISNLIGEKETNFIELTDRSLERIYESFKFYLINNTKLAKKDEILIENLNQITIIHLCFGSKVNETIGHLIGALLSTRYGATIAIKSDPYRIIIQHQRNVPVEEIKNLFYEIDTNHIPSILEITMKQSSLFRWKYTYVAKRFGLIDKNAEYQSIDIKRLIRFAHPIVFQETMREIFTEKLNLEKAKIIFNKIKKREIEIDTNFIGSELGLGEFSKIAIDNLRARNLVSPEKPIAEILETLKARLNLTQKKLICLFCGKSQGIKSISSIEDKPKCIKCGSGYLTVIHPDDDSAVKLIKKWKSGAKLDIKDKKELKKLKEIGSLILSMGKKAITVLAGRGIGLTTAKRIFSKTELDQDKLLLEILRAEKQYVETRGFWD